MNALFVLCGVGVVSLMAEIVNIRKGLSFFIVTGLALATVLVTLDWNSSTGYYNNMVVFDNFSMAFAALISVVTIFWYAASYSYFTDLNYKTDRSALLIFAVMGAYLMVAYNNIAILFLGIEILSVCMYVLAGSRKNNALSNEASFKYFLMGSFATGFLLFGVALVYGAVGSFDITVISQYLNTNPSLPEFFYVGMLLIFVGMAFKMSAVPFHFWAPDVYEGSPTNVTAFMATVVKIASVGAFYKMFNICFATVGTPLSVALQIILVLTLVVPNVTAVQQVSVKRILAYSSVAHVGYILLGLIAPGSIAVPGIFYYLITYSVATISAFYVIIILEQMGIAPTLENFQGLLLRNKLIGVTMILALLSLAGIPPLGGFFAKYLMFNTAIQEGYIGLVLVAIITSLIGVYYYFKVVRAMFGAAELKGVDITVQQRIFLVVLVVLNVILGLLPEPILGLLS